MNIIHTIILKSHLNVIVPSVPSSFEWFFFSIFLISPMYPFVQANNILRGINILKLLITQFSPLSWAEIFSSGNGTAHKLYTGWALLKYL
jgi:hypothetical protein